jgi:hypothetical protein
MSPENFINSGSLRVLRPVFVAWFEIMEMYLESFDYKDCQWWYNERATLSSLAAAVWRAGGIALEEYCLEKGKKGDLWTGRCDLYFRLKTQDFACEAKQLWCSIGRKGKPGLGNIKDVLSTACRDARVIGKNEGRRLGICFAIPYLPPSDKDIVDNQLLNWSKKLKGIDFDSIAWFFPKMARSMAIENGNVYPGVVMLIKEIFRQVY